MLIGSFLWPRTSLFPFLTSTPSQKGISYFHSWSRMNCYGLLTPILAMVHNHNRALKTVPLVKFSFLECIKSCPCEFLWGKGLFKKLLNLKHSFLLHSWQINNTCSFFLVVGWTHTGIHWRVLLCFRAVLWKHCSYSLKACMEGSWTSSWCGSNWPPWGLCHEMDLYIYIV